MFFVQSLFFVKARVVFVGISALKPLPEFFPPLFSRHRQPPFVIASPSAQHYTLP